MGPFTAGSAGGSAGVLPPLPLALSQPTTPATKPQRIEARNSLHRRAGLRCDVAKKRSDELNLFIVDALESGKREKRRGLLSLGAVEHLYEHEIASDRFALDGLLRIQHQK